MISKIKSHDILKEFIVEECCENNISVSFHPEIPRDDYVIIKVDDYYNSLGEGDTPAPVDCLIVRKCADTGYGLTLVELKNIGEFRHFKLKNLEEKFNTTLQDFIEQRFKIPLKTNYKTITLYFVSNLRNYRRDTGLAMDILINLRFKYNEKTIMLKPRIPTPMINKC